MGTITNLECQDRVDVAIVSIYKKLKLVEFDYCLKLTLPVSVVQSNAHENIGTVNYFTT